MLRILGLALVLVVVAAAPAAAQTRDVLFVANNWDGTADIVDPQTFEKLGRLNVVPDLEERLREIHTDPVRLAYFLGVRHLVGEGNDQYADDMFSSRDGRFVYVSRPSLADVVGIELASGRIVWRFPMEGYRSDHMAISPDGTRLLVSDSTARKVHALDTATGRKVGEFPSGDSPHENNYSADGARIFHASIGLVYTPADQPVADSTKGDRWFQVVDARTYEVLQRHDVGEILAAHGHPGYSSAVRPMALSPDEGTAYFQLSFLHGFVEFDLATMTPLRIATLPMSEEAARTPREQYLLDSAHHGLAMNPEGTKLCAAGTMSDYAAIVNRATFAYKLFAVGRKPYWSTNSGDGRYCFVSVSGDDRVVVLDYASEREVARIPVGDHPQRMRMGRIQAGAAVPDAPPAGAERRTRLRVIGTRVRGGTLRMRVAGARGTVRATYRSSGERLRFRLDGGGKVRRALPPRLRRKNTGMVILRHRGDRLRARAARRAPRLRVGAARIEGERLVVTGSTARRARGRVHVELGGLHWATRIRRGRWAIDEPLPSNAGDRVFVRYTGHHGRRVRGAQRYAAVAP